MYIRITIAMYIHTCLTIAMICKSQLTIYTNNLSKVDQCTILLLLMFIFLFVLLYVHSIISYIYLFRLSDSFIACSVDFVEFHTNLIETKVQSYIAISINKKDTLSHN